MNAPSQRAESTALTTIDAPTYEVGQVTNAASLILGPAFERLQTFAALMAKGSVTVPRHLHGNQGDCLAICIQALGWKMNPFAVAQKTHLSQSGALGYEAQLVSAALSSSGALKGDPEFEHIGDWSKVLGKVEERKSEKGGKYYVATYTKADEAGLGVIVRATLVGENKPRELTVMMSQAYPRFSTQWATDPKQQICYLAVRKWGRLHAPGVILGVYTTDELDEPEEKFMGPADVVQPTQPKTYPDDLFSANLPEWKKYIEAGRKTADQIIAMANTKFPLTDDQKKAVRAIKAKAKEAEPAASQAATSTDKPADTAQDAGPVVTFAQVADAIAKAQDGDKLAEAEDLIGAVAESQQRAELVALAKARREELAQ